MNSFIENLNEGRGKKMLQMFVVESKADDEKIEHRPKIETQSCTIQVPIVDKSNLDQEKRVEDQTRPSCQFDVANPNSENHYILTVYKDQILSADDVQDVLQGEFLFEDNNVEIQELQHFTKDKSDMEQDEVVICHQEITTVYDNNSVVGNNAPENDGEYIPDGNENSYTSSDSKYQEIVHENIDHNVQQQVLAVEQVEQEYQQDQAAIEMNKRAKKRLKNENNWARNLKKMKINKGEEYLTKSGNLKVAKNVKEGCGDRCKLKCSENVTLENRKKLLSDFLMLTDITRKRDFISKLINEVKPRYSYKKDDSHRSANYSYNFIVDSKRVKVCKKMFTDTFCISSTFLTTVKIKTSSTGVLQPDLRGKHLKQPKTDPQIIKDIVEHINSFARIESHYCRADTEREYIDGDLNQAEMYRLYKTSCEQKGIPFAKKHKYEEILTTKFNIGFFQPKKDQCSFCESYKNSSEEERINLQPEMDLHKKEKELSRQEKQRDKEASKEANSDLVVSCFDLQAVFQLPKGQVSTFYYKRKLNAFDFTIYDTTNNQGYCYVWNEAYAKRGALEIASFLYNYLKEYCSGTGKRVVFYSDNCSGQNKNKLLLTMYLYAVKTMDIPSITHKYLIVGHTQNEGDVMHSLIEKQMRLATRKTPIYVPSQLVALMQVANKDKNPFVVKEMDTEDVLDWKSATRLFGQNVQYNTSGERIVWANVKMFEIRKDTDNTVFYKTSYEQNEMKSFNLDDKIVKKKDGSIQVTPRGLSTPLRKPRNKSKRYINSPVDETLNRLKVKPAYQTPPGITLVKKEDLLSLCRGNLIPRPYHNFFENLKTTTTTTTEEPTLESDD